MGFDADYDVKLTFGATTRKFRLLQQKGSKAWRVSELPAQPETEDVGKVGLPPSRALPYIQEDFAWGVGLKNLTGEANPGHRLRYADGYGIDTSDVHVVRHGPAALTAISGFAEAPLQAIHWLDKVWFLTLTKLYSWDGTTLTNTYTNGAATHKQMEVHGSRLYIAGGTDYFHSADGAAFTTVTDNADRFLSIAGNQLWRAFDGNQLTDSTDPSSVTPTWGSIITTDDTITNLFTVSGIVGVATKATLCLVDPDRNLVELNKGLRNRRSSTAFSIKSESGADVWFSDGKGILRLLADGFESFDLRPSGPFYGHDDRPVDQPSPVDSGSIATIRGISQDLGAIYVVASRSDWGGAHFVYKGVEITRDLHAWSPLYKTGTTGTVTFCEVLKMPTDAAPIVYFSENLVVNRISTQWSTYGAGWELHTPYFTANLENWNKMAHNLKATLEVQAGSSRVTAFYMKDTDTTWTAFGTSTMSANGLNEIQLTTPLDNKKIRLKFVGATDSSTYPVNLRSFHLESLLRPDLKPTIDFTVIADSKEDADFLYTIRTNRSAFLAITDRFGTTRNAFLLPGYPVEFEATDEVRRAPMRVYQLQAQEVAAR